jgi:hypothetical protein
VIALSAMLAMAPIAKVIAQQAAATGFPKEKLEQLVAPIALYPDALLAQVLMAATYPLEVVQAQRWLQANPKVAGKNLEDTMQKQSWDESVKSLTAFPTVLQMMSDQLEWTQQLGDAFLAQQEDLMAAVQALRRRADDSGKLKTTKEQTVTKTTSGSQTYIAIEPANPSVVYVPAYDPGVVYGTWPYPDYPPYSYYPPGYVAGSAFWFASGVAVGAALWGRCNWGRNRIDIDVNRYNQFNRTNISSSNWEHKPQHRKGVPYGDRRVSEQYRKAASDVASREQYRGRAEEARKELAKPETKQAAREAAPRPNQPNREGRPGTPGKSPAAGEKGKAAQQPGKGAASKGPAGKAQQPRPQQPKAQQPRVSQPARQPSRPPAATRQPTAFQGVGSGPQVRRDSARGQASRHAAPRARGGGGGRRR